MADWIEVLYANKRLFGLQTVLLIKTQRLASHRKPV